MTPNGYRSKVKLHPSTIVYDPQVSEDDLNTYCDGSEFHTFQYILTEYTMCYERLQRIFPKNFQHLHPVLISNSNIVKKVKKVQYKGTDISKNTSITRKPKTFESLSLLPHIFFFPELIPEFIITHSLDFLTTFLICIPK